MSRLGVFFSKAICLFLVFCLSLPGAAFAQQAPLILGIHPFLSSTELYKRFSPLVEYLGKQMNVPVTLKIASSYDAHLEAIGKQEVDIAFLGPAPYVKLTERFGKVPLLAAYETNGSRTFRGVIVVSRESQFTAIPQLQGKRFAFGDPNSTMSHLVPRAMLLEKGVDVKQLAKYEFLTNHENIALGVLAGNFEAGAMKDDIFKQYEPQGLRALAISGSYPDHLFVARLGLPAATVHGLQKALLALKDSDEGRRLLTGLQKSLTALVLPRDADYDNLRSTMAALAKAGIAQ
ncbi:MAG: hypothetical protein A2511_08550 [Deltaproteobacteria bacterium RIFOXYD12_FULL_50_9]|nr:MAG: hypothetical protein A2511_08550 [Deltaproteobacteria bacterium RIFOXYD12_FULL_50_9]